MILSGNARWRRPFLSRNASEALRALLQVSSVGTERIPTVRARARVLAEDLYSSVDLPHFHRAAWTATPSKQGTFGASQSLPAYLKLAGVVEMGKRRRSCWEPARRYDLTRYDAAESNAVVMVEYTDEPCGVSRNSS